MVREARYIYSTVMRVADFTHPRWQLRMVKKIEEGHDDDDDGGWGCVVGLPIIMLVSINTVLATYAQHYE